MLRTAVGTDPKAYAEPYGVTDPAGVARLNEQKWDFLAQYKIQADNIYRSVYENTPPTVAELRATEQREGGLRQFNIWYFDPRLFKLDQPDTWNAQADALFDHIQPYVDQYRAAGLIDKAYLHCCDESRDEYFALIRAVLTRFKARFPDIPVLTTAIDDTMGTRSGLDELVDWWVRDVPWYSKEVLDRRHAAGREGWWYLHAGVHNPYPNLLMGYDPGQLRTLLGPMSYQSKVDGFLYYRVDRWYNHPVLADGPLSTWDPRTWNNVAGDGSLFYPGPNGPMPSIRLQNFRDGMEDYNLLTVLRTAVDHAPPGTDPRILGHWPATCCPAPPWSPTSATTSATLPGTGAGDNRSPARPNGCAMRSVPIFAALAFRRVAPWHPATEPPQKPVGGPRRPLLLFRKPCERTRRWYP
ncbi:MAG TPA: DUF4091 domain-containing protein [Streptosporangiaceae bacterium]